MGQRQRSGLHEGGYTPFEADITEHVTGGEQVRVTAVVNNTLSFQSIPPGVIEDTPAGKRQIYWHDFFNYAGIQRTVWLYSTDAAHVTDVTIVTDLDGDTGVVDYTIDAEGADDVETRVILRNADGQEVDTNTGASGTLQVPDVHKWAPGTATSTTSTSSWSKATPSSTATPKVSVCEPSRWMESSS